VSATLKLKAVIAAEQAVRDRRQVGGETAGTEKEGAASASVAAVRFKPTYSERKAMAVRTCRETLTDIFTDDTVAAAKFEASKKKDDLADTLLQALAFHRNVTSAASASASRRKKKDTPRINRDQ
jgi:hypothetical protein